MNRVIFSWAEVFAATCVGLPAGAALQPVADLADLSLEQLSRIVVTSASRRAEPLVQAPASIFVLTADDIRRSGATSLPEVLRLAPNLHVARADINQYAISARGFNNTLANKMLVLIDGRTVYTPLFSGVFWDAQDVVLEDVERIEVISGPAATLWGSNGVSGVINITTLPASRTQGSLVAAGAGNLEAGGAVRHGGALGGDGFYRVYAKYFDRRHGTREDGVAIRDESERALLGFRADWEHARDSVSLVGQGHHGTIDMVPAGRTLTGASLIGRWNRRLGDHSGLRFQAYYDRAEREHSGVFAQKRDTLDAELQHNFTPWQSHRLIWGGGYRISRDRVENSAAQAFLPPERTLHWANLFAQDEIRLREDVFLTLGAKVEHNPYTGNELLPNVRLAWQRTDHLLWGSLSRAVRAPSRIDRDLFIPGQVPFLLVGNESFDSEVARVVEIGYRAQLSAVASFSVTAFHHDFDRLRSLAPSAGALAFANDIEGRLHGIEGWGTYRLGSRWRLSGGFVSQKLRLKVKEGAVDLGGLPSLGNDPRYHVLLRSSWDLAPRYEADLAIRRVGPLPNPSVPGYTAVDARIAWKATPRLEISLAVQNLLDDSHVEWGAPANRAEYERGFFLKVLWRI